MIALITGVGVAVVKTLPLPVYSGTVAVDSQLSTVFIVKTGKSLYLEYCPVVSLVGLIKYAHQSFNEREVKDKWNTVPWCL